MCRFRMAQPLETETARQSIASPMAMMKIVGKSNLVDPAKRHLMKVHDLWNTRESLLCRKKLLAPARRERRRTGGIGLIPPRYCLSFRKESCRRSTAKNPNPFLPDNGYPKSFPIHGRITTVLCKRIPWPGPQTSFSK